MIPQPITIDGKSGTVVYLDAKWHPVTSAHATMARVLFDDGSSAFFTTAEEGTQKREYVREPAGSPKGGEFASTRQAARGAIQDAVGREIPVGVDDHPVAIRAAYETAAVLREMKAKGYGMPSEVIVNAEIRKNMAGEAERGNTLIVRVPDNLPPEMSLDEAFVAVYGQNEMVDTIHSRGEKVLEVREYVGRKFRDLVIHEMGHLDRQPMDYKENADAAMRFASEMAALKWHNFVPAANTVSKYARTNADEFVAEAFTALYNGETLPAETIRIYNALRGAKVL